VDRRMVHPFIVDASMVECRLTNRKSLGAEGNSTNRPRLDMAALLPVLVLRVIPMLRGTRVAFGATRT
jgi:hypothetical protein